MPSPRQLDDLSHLGKELIAVGRRHPIHGLGGIFIHKWLVLGQTSHNDTSCHRARLVDASGVAQCQLDEILTFSGVQGELTRARNLARAALIGAHIEPVKNKNNP